MRSVPVLFFDGTGTARMRLCGPRVDALFHYLPASVPLISLICPESKCKYKDHNRAENNVRKNMTLCFDQKKRRWAMLVIDGALLDKIVEKCKAVGITSKMIQDGTGPDILLQRIGWATQFEIMLGTVGTKVPVETMPDLADAVKKVSQKSHWNTFEDEEQIVTKYPPKPRTLV